MGYIIVPLVIILYFYWTYTTVVDFVEDMKDRELRNYSNMSDASKFWIGLHVSALSAGAITNLVYLCVKYW